MYNEKRFGAADSQVTSHFSAVFAILEQDEEKVVRLVIYDDQYSEGFELRVPGGEENKGEDFEYTAGRELVQEAGLLPEELKFLGQIDLPDDKNPDGLHIKNAFMTDEVQSSSGRIDEAEVEGFKDIPLEKLPQALTKGIDIGGSKLQVSQQFHREIISRALSEYAEDNPALAGIAADVRYLV